MPLTFETVDPADETALRAWFDVRAAAHEVDHPRLLPERWEHVRDDLRLSPPAFRAVLRLARDEHSSPVAAMRHWLDDADNTDVDEVTLDVHPAHRRGGVGRAAIEDLRTVATAERRRRLLAQVAGPVDGACPGDAFAGAMGGRMLLAEVTRVLEVDRLDHDRLRTLHAAAESSATGYHVVQWAGDVPDDLVDGFARLRTQLMHDVPLGDLELKPQVFDAARVRAVDEANRRRGRRRVASGAVHVESGELVAFTDIGTYVLPGHTAFQWDTLVLDAHRGHRLGLLLKLANLDLLRDVAPHVRQVRTVNGADNPHMVSINDTLGFVAAERLDEWQLDL